MLYKLLVIEFTYDRPSGSFEESNTQLIEIEANTDLSAKRQATKLLYNDIDVPITYECLRDPLWWNKWDNNVSKRYSFRRSDLYRGKFLEVRLLYPDNFIQK